MKLSDQARQLLQDAARAEPPPSTSQRERMLKGIRSAIVPLALVSAPTAVGTRGLLAKLTAAQLGAAKVVVAVVGVATLATTAVLYRRSAEVGGQTAPAAARVSASPPQQVEPNVPLAPTVAQNQPAPSVLAPAAARGPASPPPVPASPVALAPTVAQVPAHADAGLDFEAQLEAAQRAMALLDEEQPEEALRQVQAARERWPEGSFSQELDVLEVLAWCKSGQVASARAGAAALRARGIDAAANRRLAASCVGE